MLLMGESHLQSPLVNCRLKYLSSSKKILLPIKGSEKGTNSELENIINLCVGDQFLFVHGEIKYIGKIN